MPLQRLATGDALLGIATELHYPDVSALYAAVGEGHVSAQSVVAKLVAVGRRRRRRAGGPGRDADTADPAAPAADRRGLGRGGGRRRRRLGTAVPVLHAGARRRDHRLRHPRPRCLGPPRPTASTCATCSTPSRSGWSAVRWSPTEDSMFLVAIQVEALDRTGLLSDVTRSSPTST